MHSTMSKTMKMSLENVLSRAPKDEHGGKELGDDHTVTTKGTSMCSSMRSSRSTICSSHWASESDSKRRVQFPEAESKVVGRVQRREDLSKEERFDTWWTATEFQAIRLAAKFTTKQVRKCDQDGIEKIETGFNTALHISCTATDEELDAVLRSPPESLYGPLNQWCKRKAPVRGLEKYISNLQKELRLQYVSEARSAVVSMAKGGEHDDEDISMIYKEYSRHALVYSRFLGHTDMLAAQAEDEPEPEKKPRRMSMERTLSRLSLGRQSSHRNLERQSSQRKVSREGSKRNLLGSRQASQRGLGRQASRRALQRENSTKIEREEPSDKHQQAEEQAPVKKLQRENSTKRLVRSMSSKKIEKEGSSRKLEDGDDQKMRRQPSFRKLGRGSMHRQASARKVAASEPQLRDSVTGIPLDSEILEESSSELKQ